MDLHDYFEILRRRWVSLTIVALATLACSAAVTLAMPTKYTATTRLYFAVEGSKNLTDLAQGSSFAEKQMTSYAEVTTSPLVLNPVIDGSTWRRPPSTSLATSPQSFRRTP